MFQIISRYLSHFFTTCALCYCATHINCYMQSQIQNFNTAYIKHFTMQQNEWDFLKSTPQTLSVYFIAIKNEWI